MTTNLQSLDLVVLEKVIGLMKTHRIDCIELGDIKILKTKHDVVKPENATTSASNKTVFTDEELLFHSTSHPITLKQIEELEAGNLVINPRKGKKG